MWPLVIGLGAIFLYLATRDKSPDAPGPGNQPHEEGYSEYSCPKAGTRILLIGDSLAVGLKPRLRRFANDCSITFAAQAKVGSHVTEWPQALKRADRTGLYSEQEINPFDIVIISLGGNDYNRTDPDRVRLAIHDLVRWFEDKGTRVLWIHPPSIPIRDRIGIVPMWLRQIKHPEDWIDITKIPFSQEPDRIHPTAAGYDKLAAIIWRWVSKRSDS